MRPEALLFGESTGRVLVAGAAASAILRIAEEEGVAAKHVGQSGGDRVQIAPREEGREASAPWIDRPLSDLRRASDDAIVRHLGESAEATG